MRLLRTKIRTRRRLNYVHVTSIYLFLAEQAKVIRVHDFTSEGALVLPPFVRFGQSLFAVLQALVFVFCNELIELFFFLLFVIILQWSIVPLKKPPVGLSVKYRNIVGLDLLFLKTAVFIQSLFDNALLIGVIPCQLRVALIRFYRAAHDLTGINRHPGRRSRRNGFYGRMRLPR